MNNESVDDGTGVINGELVGAAGDANGERVLVEDGFDSESKPYLCLNNESLVEGVSVVDGDNEELLGAAGGAKGEILLLGVDGNSELLGRVVNGEVTGGVYVGTG